VWRFEARGGIRYRSNVRTIKEEAGAREIRTPALISGASGGFLPPEDFSFW